ncbi:nuclease [Quaeritorhiza haematococci]|nr:nuclease [Quaeritorhiza haematococci]
MAAPSTSSLVRKLQFASLGALLGGGAVFAYFKYQASKQQQQQQKQLQRPVPVGPISPSSPSTGVVTDVGAKLDAAKRIMKYGFHGPTSDLLYRQAYVASYNRSLRNPNWVAEHLTADSIDPKDPDEGRPDRGHSTFKEDKMIPDAFRSRLADYRGSKLDRGHLAPCADVKSSQEAVDETFYLTNISPQVPSFNRVTWLHFESFVRRLTKEFENVYVVTGPLYLPRKDEVDGKFYVKYEVIGNPPNTAVPTHFYKVILGERDGGNVLALGSFVLPNETIDNVPLEEFRVPIDVCESLEL